MIRKPLLISFIVALFLFPVDQTYAANILWNVQSIDTMKTSRDLTLYKQNDPSYDDEINKELSAIKDMGAKYVALDGAYDPAYIPWLKRWVKIARKYRLHIWYRGNFSGWHGWFGPKNMTRKEHLEALKSFILHNPELFEDGDSFTACPECEYGGPGNPLETKDFDGFRKFMLDEYDVMNVSFEQIHKQVYTNWFSMNPDVAKQVLTTDIVEKIGNVITLDYYVKDAGELDRGLDFFTHKFPDAKILIGEFGAPLPAINGTMTDEEQAIFINKILNHLYKYKDKVIGINYWVSYYDFTSLLKSDYSPKLAAFTMKTYFIPAHIKGTIINSLGDRLNNVTVKSSDGNRTTKTDNNGNFSLTIIPGTVNIVAGESEYTTNSHVEHVISDHEIIHDFILKPLHPNFIYKARIFLHNSGITK